MYLFVHVNVYLLTALSRSSDLAERLLRLGILLAELGRVTTIGVERGEELVDLKCTRVLITNARYPSCSVNYGLYQIYTLVHGPCKLIVVQSMRCENCTHCIAQHAAVHATWAWSLNKIETLGGVSANQSLTKSKCKNGTRECGTDRISASAIHGRCLEVPQGVEHSYFSYFLTKFLFFGHFAFDLGIL